MSVSFGEKGKVAFVVKNVSTFLIGMAVFFVVLPVWAQEGLKGIELSGSGVETRVILKTDVSIPYHIVTQSASKIVIDLSVTDPSQGVETDFTGADNIDQLVLKPIDQDKLRLVIRGEGLGSPVVSAVKPGSGKETNPQKVVYEGDSTKTAPAGYAMTAISTPADANQVLVAQQVPAVNKTEPTASPSDALMPHEGLDPDASGSIATENKPQPDRGSIIAPSQVEETSPSDQESPTWQDQWSEGLEKCLGIFKNHFSMGLILKMSALAGVFLVSAAILLRRIFGEDETPTSPKTGGFLAFWQGGGKTYGRRRSIRKNSFDNPSAADQKMYHPTERPVGLKGLSHVPNDIPYENPAPVVNPRQALRQYSINADSPAPQPPQRESQEIDRELKRSLNMRQAIHQTQSKKPAAPVQNKRSLSKKQMEPGLPANNTQVLDFLRSVADLMEKDGNPQGANNIKRGMNQRPKR